MAQTQLIKGVLEGCVLATIAEHEVYGYELIQALRQHGFTNLVGGTVYPLLLKLEKNGDLTSTLKPSADGPNRKYYQLTAQGQQTLATFATDWQQLQVNVAKILRQVTNDDPS